MALPVEPREIDACGRQAPALHFDDVVRRYGDHVAVDHLTLKVYCGETMALLGPNGAGKSTTIALFLGLLRPHSGSVEVFGTTPRAAVASGRVGAMLQQGEGNGLPPGVSVATALRTVSRLYPCSIPFDVLVGFADIGDLLERRTQRLSGGQAQRVRFAMAIAGNPALLFLDEPTAAMDVHSRQSFWRTMRMFGEQGHTVVFATHHLDEADNADRVVVINQGKVVADGAGATLKAAVVARRLHFAMDEPDRLVLDRLQGVTDVHVRGCSITLDSLDADATVRDLVAVGIAFRDLEVPGARLEDAFMALTTRAAPVTESAHRTDPADPTHRLR